VQRRHLHQHLRVVQQMQVLLHQLMIVQQMQVQVLQLLLPWILPLMLWLLKKQWRRVDSRSLWPL
jgi:hypothetical protein